MSSSDSKLRQPGLIVYFSGVGTSGLMLWLVHYLNESLQFNVMGWYINGILPAGAMAVGVASGTGYAIASRLLHAKISRAFLVGMIFTAMLDYSAAQYLTYTNFIEKLHVPADVYTFVDYIRDTCEKMAFNDRHTGKAGEPLGAFGYVFKLLELAGYAAGAIYPTFMVFGMPYCKNCQQYLKLHRTGYINSPESWADVKKLSRGARSSKLQSLISALAAQANQVVGPVLKAPFTETEAAIAALDPGVRKGTAGRIAIELRKCSSCDAHHLRLRIHTFSANKKAAAKVLSQFDKTELA
jgi:hypothetical protein